MKDILGRELHDGDMAVGMAIGRHSRGMHVGVIQGSSVCRLAQSYSGDSEWLEKSSTSNTYLIENPTEREIEIKRKIETLLQQEEEKRKKKAAIKTIPLSKLEIGGIYKGINENYYVYLGKRKVTFEDFYRSNSEIKEGNCFVYIYSVDNGNDESIREDILAIDSYRRGHRIEVLKGNKKLVEFIRKIELEFPLVKKEKSPNGWYGSPYNFRLIIE